jgi:hypothetical protein
MIVTLKLKTHLLSMITHAMIIFRLKIHALCEGNEAQMVIYENPSYYEINDAPLHASNSTSKIIDDNENCVLDMLYDNALDDGPMLIDNPPCLEVVTKLCEDKDDILSVCIGTLTHESPNLFLNSPNYTLEEKFAYVKKYLCDL